MGFNAKKYETLSYLPELGNAEIMKQIQYMIKNRWTPALEFTEDGEIYLNTRWGQDTTTTGTGRCTSCQCSDAPIRTRLFVRSKLARETGPWQKSESLRSMPFARCRQQDSS